MRRICNTCNALYVFDNGTICGPCQSQIDFTEIRHTKLYRQLWDEIDLDADAGIDWCDVEEDDYSEDSYP